MTSSTPRYSWNSISATQAVLLPGAAVILVAIPECVAPDVPNPSPSQKVRSSEGSWGGARNVERLVGGARSRARHLGGGGGGQKQGEWGEARTKVRQVGGTRIKARHVGGVRSRSETSGGSKGPDGKAKGSNATSTAERRRRETSTAEQQSRVTSTAEPQGQATSTAEQQRRATSTAKHSHRATSTDERRLRGDDVRLAGVWNSPRGGRVGASSGQEKKTGPQELNSIRLSVTTGELVRWSPACKEKCLRDQEYAEFREVFSEERAARLPVHQPWDCAIDLLPNASPPRGRVYPLSLPESKAMEEYIETALAAGHIRPSTSPAAAGFFLWGKRMEAYAPV
ncbi:hypothetical protein QTP86_004064 [Hemibagrus guttatus]|nr:hypothetical protein QTP86_004064 [Hemibagrus guttatus]